MSKVKAQNKAWNKPKVKAKNKNKAWNKTKFKAKCKVNVQLFYEIPWFWLLLGLRL